MSMSMDRAHVAIPWPLTLALAAAALGLGIWFGFGLLQPPERAAAVATRAATLLPQLRPLGAFALTDQRGQPFTPESLKGRWTFVAFGYTHCPDVCPTTLAAFNEIDRILGEQGRPGSADFLFVSVDPERDSVEKLAPYLAFFNPAFKGATGPHESLRKLTDQFGVLYARAEDQDTALGYLVDHTASVLLVDPEARLAAIFSAPHDPAAMAGDFLTITKTTH